MDNAELYEGILGYSYVASLPYSKDLLCSRVKSLVVDFRHKFSQVTSSNAV